MDQRIIEIAASVLKVSAEAAAEHCKQVPEINGYYFWNPARGGLAVLINDKGEKLGATSGVSFERHLTAFKEGRRN